LRDNVDWFFHQTKASFDLAKSIQLEQSSVSGDTRFDRVKQFQTRDNFVEFIEGFKQNQQLIIYGSSWESEEKIAEIVAREAENLKIIIAPHDLKRIPSILITFPEAVLYSQFSKTEKINQSNTKILLIDSIGILSKLYSFADLAAIGGGFHSAGLHNILEAATFGVPTVFGNKYRKNPEADALIVANGAKSFNDENEAADFILNIINDGSKLEEMSMNAKEFINNQPNASEIILSKILS